jgi:acetyl-CoA C-acetyltransferase
MKDVVIVEACRTAVGSMGGTLRPMEAEDIACGVVKGVLNRSKVAPEAIDEVILGHCRQTSDNPNIARIVALRCGIPESATAYTVMRQCASGMTAVHNGAMSILCGQNEVVLAGGTESMSNAVFYLRGGRYGLGTGNAVLLDSLTEGQFCSQPREIYGTFNMGVTAENIAEQMGITRQEQDAFALSSQIKAADAISSAASGKRSFRFLYPRAKSRSRSYLIPTNTPVRPPWSSWQSSSRYFAPTGKVR